MQSALTAPTVDTPEILRNIINPETIGEAPLHFFWAPDPSLHEKGKQSNVIWSYTDLDDLAVLASQLSAWKEGVVFNIGAGGDSSQGRAIQLAQMAGARTLLQIDPFTFGDARERNDFSPFNVTGVEDYDGLQAVLVKCEGLQFLKACVRSCVDGILVSGLDNLVIEDEAWHLQLAQEMHGVFKPDGQALTIASDVRRFLRSPNFNSVFQLEELPIFVDQKA